MKSVMTIHTKKDELVKPIARSFAETLFKCTITEYGIGRRTNENLVFISESDKTF